MTPNRWIAALGGIALIGASFLEWIEIGIGVDITRTGFDLELPVYVNWDEVNLADSAFVSAGAATVVVGLLVVAGALMSRPWLTRLGGLLGVLAVALLWFSLSNTNDMLIGFWVLVGGAVLATVGAFLPSPRGLPAQA